MVEELSVVMVRSERIVTTTRLDNEVDVLPHWSERRWKKEQI